MFNNYIKRYSVTNYGGNNWNWLMGYEKTEINGIATYYAIDYPLVPSRIVMFNQYWIYKDYQNLPFYNTYTTKYVNGYFYFSSDNYFYKTNSNFSLLNFYKNTSAHYHQFVYDTAGSKFYVAPESYSQIDVFDLSCSLLQSINLGSKQPYGLAAFNGNLYIGVLNSNQVLVMQSGSIIRYFTVNQCSISKYQIISITVDSFGYLAITCAASNLVVVYDSNGNYMNASISTSFIPYITAIDANGRLVIMTTQSLNIYY